MVEIENRDQGEGWYDYGFPTSHGRVLRYRNRADNDEWDALVLGYRRPNFLPGQRFRTNKILGVILVNDGNHKLLLKIPFKRGFDQALFKSQSRTFLRNYSRQWPALEPVVYYDQTKKRRRG